MKPDYRDKCLDAFLEKLSKKQFRRQKHAWLNSQLSGPALALIHGGHKEGEGDAYARWNRA